MASIHVEIVTPQKKAFSAEAREVRAPGFLGEFGVLPEHTNFLSVVRPGVVTILGEKGEQRFVVGRGFVEAGPDRLTLLTELCEAAADVDKGEAQRLLDASEKTLVTADASSGEYANAERNADLARARLSV
jgi:F-type H+-transporting ATPase subunit epsilon